MSKVRYFCLHMAALVKCIGVSRRWDDIVILISYLSNILSTFKIAWRMVLLYFPDNPKNHREGMFIRHMRLKGYECVIQYIFYIYVASFLIKNILICLIYVSSFVKFVSASLHKLVWFSFAILLCKNFIYFKLLATTMKQKMHKSF